MANFKTNMVKKKAFFFSPQLRKKLRGGLGLIDHTQSESLIAHACMAWDGLGRNYSIDYTRDPYV